MPESTSLKRNTDDEVLPQGYSEESQDYEVVAVDEDGVQKVKQYGNIVEIVVADDLVISPESSVRIDLDTLENYEYLGFAKKIRVYYQSDKTSDFELSHSARIDGGSRSTAEVVFLDTNNDATMISESTRQYLIDDDALPFPPVTNVQESFIRIENKLNEEVEFNIIFSLTI